VTAGRPCRPTGRRPRPAYRSARLVRHRRVRLTADVAAGPAPVMGRRARVGARQAAPPASRPPAPATPRRFWPARVRDGGAATVDRAERGGLIALIIVVLAVLAGGLAGGSYLWRRQHAAALASPADCAIAVETLVQGAALTADPLAAATWRAERDAAQQQIRDEGLYGRVGLYTGYVVQIATGAAEQPTEADKRDLAAELTSRCRQELIVEWPAGG
jgi:hypothetical protein